jgi:ribose transport system substrate-binding protein
MSHKGKILFGTLATLVVAAALGAVAFGGSLASPPVSVFCSGPCKTALTMKASPASVSCTVGLSWNSFLHPYGATTGKRTQAAQKKFFPKMKLIVSDGRGDATVQTNGIDDMIAKGVNVIIISPQDAQALAPAVKRAEAKGIKVIASDRSVNAPVVTYIGADNVDTGRVAAAYVAKILKGKGTVVELQGSPGASPTIDRHKGFSDVLKKFPGVKVIGSQPANYNRADGLRVMADFLQRFGKGKINAVYTHNDEMSLGAIQAIKEAGRSGEIKVVGIDGETDGLNAIKSGAYAGTVVYPIDVPEHLIAAAKACSGEKLPKRIKLSALLVTKANVAKFVGKTF